MPDYTQRVAPMAGLMKFVSGTASYSRADTTPPGGVSMTRAVVVAPRYVTLVGGAQSFYSNHGVFSQGCHLRTNGTAMLFSVGDGAGVTASAQVTVPFSPNRWGILIGSYDGTTVRVRLDGASNAVVAGNPGYTAPTGVTRVGAQGGVGAGNPCVDFAIGAVVCSDGVALSDAQMVTWIAAAKDALEQGRALPAFQTPAVVNEDYIWDARDLYSGTARWTDQVSSLVLTRNGDPSPVGLPARIF